MKKVRRSKRSRADAAHGFFLGPSSSAQGRLWPADKFAEFSSFSLAGIWCEGMGGEFRETVRFNSVLIVLN